jgi:hypothetical protein
MMPHLIGTTSQITVHRCFEQRLHNFIIAIPEWV